MKKLLLFLLLFASPFISKAETFIVEVGGGPTITPYYAPQNLTINVGDTIMWDFVSGTHNVTSTSGPVSFASGNLSSPNEFMFVFDVAGTYDYECTLFDHADTQFGTIIVDDVDGISENLLKNELVIYPNPSSDMVKVELSANNFVDDIRLIDPSGRTLNYVDWNSDTYMLNVSDLTPGLYILLIETSKGLVKENLQIEK